ncbi:MAG: type II toxin-antitoxin system VapC family toxin, partial [Candidatus Heimdallarchaeota archaeon]
DTDVIIDYLAGKKAARIAVLELLIHEKSLATTVINISELFRGIIRRKWEQQRKAQLRSFLDNLLVVNYDQSVATLIGDLLAQLDSKGKPIGFADTAIAGLCLSIKASLVTNNVKHFSLIPDLVLEQ